MTTKSVCMYKVYSAFEFEKTCLRRCYEDSQKNYSFDQILESLNKNIRKTNHHDFTFTLKIFYYYDNSYLYPSPPP